MDSSEKQPRGCVNQPVTTAFLLVVEVESSTHMSVNWSSPQFTGQSILAKLGAVLGDCHWVAAGDQDARAVAHIVGDRCRIG